MKVESQKIYNYICDNQLQIEKLVNDYTNYIHTIITKSNNNLLLEDIEEIISDVFYVVWKNQNKLDINKDMSSYIAGITRNLIRKKYREIRINDSIENCEEQLIDNNLNFGILEDMRLENILDELGKFKEKDRKIFIKYYYEERTIKEISIIFDMSESKVKSKLFRIRKRIKKLIQERGDDLNEK